MSQRRTGVLLSFFNFAVSIAGNLFFTPALIRLLGDDQYSLYQVMRSLGGTLLMFNLGVSSIVARSIARCHETGTDESEKQNTLAIGLCLSAGLAILVAAVSLIISACIPRIYQQRYDTAQLEVARQLFLLFSAASICHILTDAFAGCLIGHERFAANALVVTLKYAIRFGMMFLYIRTGADVRAIAGVDLMVGAAALVCMAIYAFFVLHERPRLTRISRSELRRMSGFSIAVLLQAAVTRLNANMDPILLGWAGQTASAVTMYASALTIYQLYHELISMFGHYYLAHASRLVARSATGRELTDMVIRPGQLQAALALGVIAGFALFGRSFITLWIGEKYQNAYSIVLILMIPDLIPLVQSTAISILDAQFKRMYRAVVLLTAAALNIVLSIGLIRWIGHWGAAIGTAVSVLLGHGLMMNRFYARQTGLEIPRMFAQIFRPVLLPAFVSSLFSLPLLLLPQAWPVFFCQCALFMAVYGLMLFLNNRRIHKNKQKG